MKAATIGKLLFFLLSGFSLHADVTIVARDINGELLEQAMIHEPFEVEIVINNVPCTPNTPHLESDKEALHIRYVGKRTLISNNKAHHVFSYRAQALKSGSIKIGPVTIDCGAMQLVASPLILPVSEEPITQDAHKNSFSWQGKRGVLELFLNKDQVIVGERVRATLRLHVGDSLMLASQEIGVPALQNFAVRSVKGPYKKAEDRDGGRDHYLEWTWDLFPRAAGLFTIPAHHIDYEVEERIRNSRIWGGLNLFFGGNYFDRKRAYSNAVRLAVDALPTTEDTFGAIGEFTSLRIEASPAHAPRGQAVVMRVDLEGDGDLDGIEHFELQGIPTDAFRWYESRKITIDNSSEGRMSIRRFEYVLQGMEEGSWEIPSQTFSYFDVKKRKHKKLRSNPVTITITPSSLIQPPLSADQDKKFLEINGEEKQYDTLSAFDLAPWYITYGFSVIPWSVFIFLFFVTYALFSLGVLVNATRVLLPRMSNLGMVRSLRRLSAWYRAYFFLWREQRVTSSSLSAALNIGRSHAILTRYVIGRCLRDPETGNPITSLDAIEKFLYSRGASPKDLVAWRIFYEKMTAEAFGSQDLLSQTEQMVLIQETYRWLSYLEQCARS